MNDRHGNAPIAGPRVIFVNRFYDPDHSATAQILTDLCRHLAVQGLRVTVVTSRSRYDDPAARLSGHEDIAGVDIVRVATSRFGRTHVAGRLIDYATFYLSAALALFRLVRRGDVLVAKTDPPLISVVAAAVARVKRARLINWLQDLYPEVAVAMGIPGVGGAAGGIVRGLRNWSLRQAWANIAIGERMAERLATEKIDAGRIAVMPNWADDAMIAPIAAADNPLRRDWGFAADDVVVAYSGNLGRAHDVQTMLAAARLLEHRSDIKFLMVGGGYLSASVAEGRAANIVQRPYQPRERIAQSLAVGDVHWLSLLPSFEGLIVPSKFFGIAAAGRPVLAVVEQSGELGRLVRAHRCGTVISPGDGVGMAAAILAFADDPAERMAAGNRARAMLDGGFRQAATLDRLTRLIQAVAGGDRPAPLAPDLLRGDIKAL